MRKHGKAIRVSHFCKKQLPDSRKNRFVQGSSRFYPFCKDRSCIAVARNPKTKAPPSLSTARSRLHASLEATLTHARTVILAER